MKKVKFLITTLIVAITLIVGFSSIADARQPNYSVGDGGYILPGNPSYRQVKQCINNNGAVYCGNGWCYCAIFFPQAR